MLQGGELVKESRKKSEGLLLREGAIEQPCDYENMY